MRIPNPAPGPVPPVVPGMPTGLPAMLQMTMGATAAANAGGANGQIAGVGLAGGVGCLKCAQPGSPQLRDIQTSWPLWTKIGLAFGLAAIAGGIWYSMR